MSSAPSLFAPQPKQQSLRTNDPTLYEGLSSCQSPSRLTARPSRSIQIPTCLFVGNPRGRRLTRNKIWMRHRAVRRLHRTHRGPSDALLRDAALRRARSAHSHDRRHQQQSGESRADRLDRSASSAMRLLPVRPDHVRCRSPCEKQDAVRCGHRCRHARQHLPLRYLSAHPRRNPCGCTRWRADP